MTTASYILDIVIQRLFAVLCLAYSECGAVLRAVPGAALLHRGGRLNSDGGRGGRRQRWLRARAGEPRAIGWGEAGGEEIMCASFLQLKLLEAQVQLVMLGSTALGAYGCQGTPCCRTDKTRDRGTERNL
eukprot:4995689-Pleurochrysis_carterae.AAC.4